MSFRLPRGQFFQRTRSPSVADQDYRWASNNQCSSSRCYRLVKSLQPPQDGSGNNNNIDTANNKTMATVFKAVHLSSGHPVVVKLVDLDRLGDLEDVEYEVAHLKYLHHDNLVPLLASFVDGPHLWNVFTWAEYSSADLCARPYGLPEQAIAFIVKDVLSALSYLHKRGMIHRAVRGSHVLITSKGTCLLTGMKYMTTVLRNLKWQPIIHEYPRNSVANLAYLAPEIVEQTPSGYNAKSDIYSVGVLCAELANGAPPFEEKTQMLLDKLVGNHPKPLDGNSAEVVSYVFGAEAQDIPAEVRDRYDHYKTRTFSSTFHKFVADACTIPFTKRPTADKILRSHQFLRLATNRKRNLLGNIARRQRDTESESDQEGSGGDLEELDAELGRMKLADSGEAHDKRADNSSGWAFDDTGKLC